MNIFSKPSLNPSGERSGQDGAEGLLEGIEEEVLDGESELFNDVELSAPPGLADGNPVCGSVAGPLKRSHSTAVDEKNTGPTGEVLQGNL